MCAFARRRRLYGTLVRLRPVSMKGLQLCLAFSRTRPDLSHQFPPVRIFSSGAKRETRMEPSFPTSADPKFPKNWPFVEQISLKSRRQLATPDSKIRTPLLVESP